MDVGGRRLLPQFGAADMVGTLASSQVVLITSFL